MLSRTVHLGSEEDHKAEAKGLRHRNKALPGQVGWDRLKG